jgi:hypothetical protein
MTLLKGVTGEEVGKHPTVLPPLPKSLKNKMSFRMNPPTGGEMRNPIFKNQTFNLNDGT